ncbi:MAG: PspA/IM30 family protein [Acidobacteriia bacterium]|nr:PspA/IM30 family protein [Terriglobia bacterium]
MALMERVSTLLRANLNDLVDRAEDPEKMLKQMILDMENQLMQVKTQVAISIADLHLLEWRAAETALKADDWMRKARLAVEKSQDDLARVGIERSLESKKLSGNFQQQIADQKAQADTLRTAFLSLEGKLVETRAKAELLLATHRRAKVTGEAAKAQLGLQGGATAWARMNLKVQQAEALGQATAELAGEDIESRFAALEKVDEVDRLLAELKERRTS